MTMGDVNLPFDGISVRRGEAAEFMWPEPCKGRRDQTQRADQPNNGRGDRWRDKVKRTTASDAHGSCK
jgi:hypothetical protein